MNRLLITICGRAGSKGFKNKNLKTFCGHPLVYYSLSAAELFIKKHPELHIDIALNTDSPELAELVAAKYPEVIFLPRGEELRDILPLTAAKLDERNRRAGQVLPPHAHRRSDELLARRVAAVAVQRQLRRAVLAQQMGADPLVHHMEHRIKSDRREHGKHTLPENRHAIPSCSQLMPGKAPPCERP